MGILGVNYSVPLEITEKTLRCRNHFACLNGRGHGLCDISEALGSGSSTVLFVEPRQDAPVICPYRKCFGDSLLYCACPTRFEIYKRYGK